MSSIQQVDDMDYYFLDDIPVMVEIPKKNALNNLDVLGERDDDYASDGPTLFRLPVTPIKFQGDRNVDTYPSSGYLRDSVSTKYNLHYYDSKFLTPVRYSTWDREVTFTLLKAASDRVTEILRENRRRLDAGEDPCTIRSSWEQLVLERVVLVCFRNGTYTIKSLPQDKFLESLADNQKLGISGDQLNGVTQEVVGYRAVNLTYDSNNPVVIVDTPGFNDPELSETKIIRMIAQQKVGYIDIILYFHRISDIRIPRSQRNIMALFQALLGKRERAPVGIVTTMWDQMWDDKHLSRAESRFREFEASFGKGFVGNGVPVFKFKNNKESALQILNGIEDDETWIGSFMGAYTGGRLKYSPFADSLRGLLDQRIDGLRCAIQTLDQDLIKESPEGHEGSRNVLRSEKEKTEKLLNALEKERDELTVVPLEKRGFWQTIKNAYAEAFADAYLKEYQRW
ncbi:hypothetical protein CVT24_008779 [Panaeolus cyanescens]|uniref:G domain-containing protein n=1 Tax=Panaeolus cyanescens TaxID=181874 RepID=A0A409VCV0_9AGAR|nr:hypothetical protein CVT24_008779 [Panaeolus cyanescens]